MSVSCDGSTEDANSHALVCNPQLRDVWSHILGFVTAPHHVRRSCQFLVECWDHAVYLECQLSCPYIRLAAPFPPGDTVGGEEREFLSEEEDGGGLVATVPLPLSCLANIQSFCSLFISNVTGIYLLDDRDLLSGSVLSLHIFRLPHLRQLGTDFLSWCLLREFVLEELPELVSIESDVLSHCECLERVTLRTLHKLVSIGGDVLSHCTALHSMEMVDLPALVIIGDSFLAFCGELGEIVVEEMPRLEYIGVWFCYRCYSLTTAMFANLPVLASIGEEAMMGCEELHIIQFTGLHTLTEIGRSEIPEGTRVKFADGCHPNLPTLCRTAFHCSDLL